MLQPAQVSVVIPTFNCEQFIRDTLRSVFAASQPAGEIIVVDDCSTDSTCTIVDEFARESTVPLRLIRLSTNRGGPAAPMNVGVESASGQYIALLDHDDLMLPDKLRRQAQVLDAHPEVELVLSDYHQFEQCDERPEMGGREIAGDWYTRLCSTGDKVVLVARTDMLVALAHVPGLHRGCSGMLFRRELWEAIGGFDPLMGPASDVEFLFRAIRRPIAWIDSPLFLHRRHAESLSRRDGSTELVAHCVVESWLVSESAKLPADTVTSIRTTWARRLTRAARSAKRRRDWISYWILRDRLASFDYRECGAIVGEHIYPKWAYRIKDRVKSMMCRSKLK